MPGSDPRLPNGARLAHYEIASPIGEGAMGVVYRAHDTALDRPVAVKVLKDAVAEDVDLVARFFREARAAAKVNHPHLTHVYFVGHEGESHFFAMELLPGSDLEDHTTKHGPMAWHRAVDVMIQTAQGLAAAHEAGVIHRDVKPSNIILQPNGQAKVTDFGLAKSLRAADIDATQAGSLLGTPRFMSPEQCRGKTVDARTDIYALGLTAWYLMTGQAPYEGDSLGEMLDRQMNAPLPSLRAENPDIPEELDRALARMCAKDPDKRPRDMDEVAQLLSACRPGAIHGAGIAARAVATVIDFTVVIALVALTWLALGIDMDNDKWGALTTGVWWTMLQLFSEAAWGRSLGKWLMQLHVVTNAGGRPAFRDLLLRYLIRFPGIVGWLTAGVFLADDDMFLFDWLSWAALAAGLGCFAWTYFKRKPARTLSDLLTKTRVAYRVAAEPGPDAKD